MPKVKSENIFIRYDEQGSIEPALLFLPGWCDSRTVFIELASYCSAHRRTLSLD